LIDGGDGPAQVDAGDEFSVALWCSDGHVTAWGNNPYGQLGNGTTTGSEEPVLVSDLSDVVQVTAGSKHALALKSDGTVWAWGANFSGELGDGSTFNRNTPVQVRDLTDVVAVSAGHGFSLALKANGWV